MILIQYQQTVQPILVRLHPSKLDWLPQLEQLKFEQKLVATEYVFQPLKLYPVPRLDWLSQLKYPDFKQVLGYTTVIEPLPLEFYGWNNLIVVTVNNLTINLAPNTFYFFPYNPIWLKSGRAIWHKRGVPLWTK